MKHQYACDIGDFGKYLLLHYIIDPGDNNKSLSLGINWFLTPNDNKSDGRFIDYLEHDKHNISQSLPPISYKIYNSLKKIYKIERSIDLIQKEKMLPTVIYYSDIVDNKNRSTWLNNSILKLFKSDVIFLDPDNGIAINERRKDLSKYVTIDDLRIILKNTQSNLIIYHHAARPKGGLELFAKERIFRIINNLLPGVSARILWYHKGTARLYIFIIRKDEKLINSRLDSFIRTHKYNLFTEIRQ